MKNATLALAFTTILTDEDGIVAILENCRLMDGFIHPPQIFLKSNKSYRPTARFSVRKAKELYDAIVAAEWVEKFKLPPLYPVEKAIIPLKLTEEIATLAAPSLL